MNDVVERVADAIEATTGTVGFSYREWVVLAARAAIDAMREDDLRLELAKRKFDGQFEILENGCHQWTGAIDRRDGYSRFYDGSGRTTTGYGFIWSYHHGAVSPGNVIDHTCRNRACVNVSHLREVTNAENVLCGVGITAQNIGKTHCRRGHPYDDDNLYVRPDGARGCRECLRASRRAFKARRRAALADASPDIGKEGIGNDVK